MKRNIIIIICIMSVFLIASIFDSFNHSRTDKPTSANVIIMVAGDEGRMEKAVELYHKGYAEYILITPVSEKYYWQSVEFALTLGVLENSIIKEHEAVSTYTNATRTFEIMEAYNFKSALVVTSDYHLKRTKMIYDRMNDNDFKLDFIAALSPNEKKWYEREDAKSLWFREYYKLWGYRLGLYKFIN